VRPQPSQPPATGNTRGIGLARAVLRAYQHVPTQSYVEHGLVWMSAMDGKAPTFQWAYGLGPYPGAYPATEHAVLTLDRGRVSWWRDDLTPAPCTKPGVCPRAPVEIVANTRGLFYAFGSASKHSCYTRLGGTAPYETGQPAWIVGGRFDAPVRSGASNLSSAGDRRIGGTRRLAATLTTDAPSAGVELTACWCRDLWVDGAAAGLVDPLGSRCSGAASHPVIGAATTS
jgi:hypothetical protein